jgi:hypothetical protein
LQRQGSSQIATLETELAKLTKSLESSKATYTSLQKQYQEQVSISDKYRSDLRHRDQMISSLRETASLYQVEQEKWAIIERNYEERLAVIQRELDRAEEVGRELDEQKRENWALKETIDRMKYDMDELRQSLASGINMSSSTGPTGVATPSGSRDNTVSKSLGAELLGKMRWGISGNEPPPSDDEDAEREAAEEDDEEESRIIEKVLSGEDTEQEDVIQTIITRKKKKVPSRAKDPTAGTKSKSPVPPELRHFEESKEYSDSGVQYDIVEEKEEKEIQVQAYEPPRTEMEIQTDPVPALIQWRDREKIVKITEEVPVPVFPEPRDLVEMGVQASPPEPEPVVIKKEEEMPKAGPSRPRQSLPLKDRNTPFDPLSQQLTLGVDGEWDDLPPAYDGESSPTDEVGVLRKWHRELLEAVSVHLHPNASGKGVSLKLEDGTTLISKEAREAWERAKAKGLRCDVIDQCMEASRAAEEAAAEGAEGKKPAKTPLAYLDSLVKYISKNKGTTLFGSMSLLALIISASNPHWHIPGGPSFEDRLAWQAYNTLGGGGEGFGRYEGYGYGGYADDGVADVWRVLARVFGGAVGVVRGFPIAM